jgi:glucokinase
MKDKVEYILGFDVGGTKIAVCLSDQTGKIIDSARIKSAGTSPDEVLDKLAETGKELFKRQNLDIASLKALGIGAPGPMDIKAGTISPANMPGWNKVPIKSYLENSFGVTAFFENDANAAALAEWLFGAGRGVKNMIYLTMSTGIGAGIIAEGHLLRGALGITGECGHVVIDVNGPPCKCGLRGCYEAFCGGRAIADRIRKEISADNIKTKILDFAEGNPENIDMLALEKAVRANDDYAVDLWDEMCQRNAQAMGGFLNIFNPEKLVLGTIAWAAGDLFMEPLMRYICDYTWPEILEACDICVCGLGREIGEYSGAAVALYSLYEQGKWQLPWEKQN